MYTSRSSAGRCGPLPADEQAPLQTGIGALLPWGNVLRGGGLVGPTGLRDRPIQPLSHLSAGVFTRLTALVATRRSPMPRWNSAGRPWSRTTAGAPSAAGRLGQAPQTRGPRGRFPIEPPFRVERGDGPGMASGGPQRTARPSVADAPACSVGRGPASCSSSQATARTAQAVVSGVVIRRTAMKRIAVRTRAPTSRTDRTPGTARHHPPHRRRVAHANAGPCLRPR